MAVPLTTAPVLSTSDTHIFEDPTPVLETAETKRLTDEELLNIYEISRTALEIHDGKWRRIALQFPDHMLHDAPRVFEALELKLADHARNEERDGQKNTTNSEKNVPRSSRQRLFILADTSYGACCVDEIAAEHADAEVIVHYGRSCLSPTARLPVIYVFTTRDLPLEPLIKSFESTFSEKNSKILLMADVMYHNHIKDISDCLTNLGYTNVFAPSILHDPSSPLPNRTIPPEVAAGDEDLKSYQLFHISDPPPALLLTLSSRLQAMYIYPTTSESQPTTTIQARTNLTLNRRYAILTSLSTCPVFGILINTLSMKNYLQTVTHIQSQISAAGKKSYTFVVGKVNAAKVANFSEIGGWVVIGCWESSLIESRDFFRPIITPFELSLALQGDGERVWTGEWTGDFSGVLETPISEIKIRADGEDDFSETTTQDKVDQNSDDEEESEPPEFDLRTGRYVSHSRPMKKTNAVQNSTPNNVEANKSHALVMRAKGDLATVNGAVSPGAEFLKSQRTWTGLGSDFEIAYDAEDTEKGSSVEEGRSGIARGYAVGEREEKH